MPAAALACTPLVAGISGQVSLVAVAANLVVAPVVGSGHGAGVCSGGVVGPGLGPGGAGWSAPWRPGASPGSWSSPRHGAALPGAALDWGTTPWSAGPSWSVAGPRAAHGRRAGRAASPRTSGAAACLLLVVVTVAGPPSPGWPPSGWVFAALRGGPGRCPGGWRAGAGSAVVVDAGPDPRAVDRCLRRLGVDRVPLLVLTHFHADHVDGLAGVLDHRQVGEVEVTRLADPRAAWRRSSPPRRPTPA